MSKLTCLYCKNHCVLDDGEVGKCRARINCYGHNTSLNNGLLTSIAYDPIEKKPLLGYYPGSYILSVGSFGCNLSCWFCQNHEISMADIHTSHKRYVSSEELAKMVLQDEDNLGIAFTYNEPCLSFEYIIKVSKQVRVFGKKVVLVSNGCFSDALWDKLIDHVDAINIDLKGDEAFYQKIGGDYEMVLHSIKRFHDANKHVEVTSLIVPGFNDTEEFIKKASYDLAQIDPNIIYHITRYFPSYHEDHQPTDINCLKRLQKQAQTYLKHVVLGNV